MGLFWDWSFQSAQVLLAIEEDSIVPDSCAHTGMLTTTEQLE